MAFKILNQKQTLAAIRSLARQGRSFPNVPGRCVTIRKTGKGPKFGLPGGVSMELCREIMGGRDIVTARTMGPKRKSTGLGQAKRKRRSSKRR